MKQFQFTTRTGETLLVRNFEEATFGMSAYDRGYMAEIPVGGSMRTRDGYWTRLPDLVDAEMEMAGQRAERLERIALEYLRILLPAHLNGVRLECSVAEAAVRNAKALIAELDKQA